MLCFNEQKAATLGLRPRLAHLVMMGLITLAVVSSFQAVGALLVFGLLIAPPATAVLLARRVPTVMAVAAALGIFEVVAGLLISYPLRHRRRGHHVGAGGGGVLPGAGGHSGAGRPGGTEGASPGGRYPGVSMRRLLPSLIVLALAVARLLLRVVGHHHHHAWWTPPTVPPATGPGDLVFEDQMVEGSVVVVGSVTLPSAGFVVLQSDASGTPGEVLGVSELIGRGTVSGVAVPLFFPLEAGAVLHATLHIDMDGDGQFRYEPPDDFIDLPATLANGEPATAGGHGRTAAPAGPGGDHPGGPAQRRRHRGGGRGDPARRRLRGAPRRRGRCAGGDPGPERLCCPRAPRPR